MSAPTLDARDAAVLVHDAHGRSPAAAAAGRSFAAAPRRGFRPPRLILPHRDRCGTAYAATPVWTDFWGEAVVTDAPQAGLAWDATHLYAKLCWQTPPKTARPELAPDDPDFWRQDHVDIHFLPDPADEGRDVQIIVTPDGRAFDNRGLWKDAEALAVETDGDAVTLRLRRDAAGIGGYGAGGILYGLVSAARWTDGVSELISTSPVHTGFNKTDRFAQWVLAEAAPVGLDGVAFPGGALCKGANEATVTLENRTGAPLRGMLLVEADRGTETLPTLRRTATLEAGRSDVAVVLELERPAYRRYRFAFLTDDGVHLDLGEATLRAEAAPIPDRLPPHPRILNGPEGLDALREKRDLPAFRALVEQIRPSDALRKGTDIDIDENTPADYAVGETESNWLRLAREILLRDGEGGRTPVAARIWSLLPDAAKEAARAIDRTTETAEAHVGAIVDGLREILGRRDFYDPELFAGLHLPPEAEEALAKGVDALDETALQRLNRIVLQNAVPHIRAFRMGLIGRVARLAEAWAVLGDDDLLAAATRAARIADRWVIPNGRVDLGEGNACLPLGMAYDLVRDRLSPADREPWVRLLARFLDIYIKTAREGHWNTTSIPNANPVCNGGGGMIALALLEDRPDAAREALGYARKYLWNWIDWCNGENGGNTEGAQYWQYGSYAFLVFGLALERTLGSDEGILSANGIRRAMDMVRVGLSNDGCMHGLNDTIPMPVGSPIAAWHASRYGDAFALWTFDHAQRVYAAFDAAGRKTPYRPAGFGELMLRPALPEATEAPPFPTLLALDDIQYGVLRSAPRYDCDWTVFLKGSRPPYTHHNQADTGALSVHVRGERLLIDPGYYKGEADKHCLPLVDGTGPAQPHLWTGRFTGRGELDDLRWLALDSTAAYRGAAGRVGRIVALAGGEGVVVLDDIAPPDGKGSVSVRSQWQAGAPTAARDGGKAFDIVGETTRLAVHPDAPTLKPTDLQDERTLDDTHWGYHFSTCRWHPAYTDWTADGRAPLLTVIQPADADAPAVNRTEETVDVTLASGRRVSFARERAGWRLLAR